MRLPRMRRFDNCHACAKPLTRALAQVARKLAEQARMRAIGGTHAQLFGPRVKKCFEFNHSGDPNKI
jgi:hypothetical protein